MAATTFVRASGTTQGSATGARPPMEVDVMAGAIVRSETSNRKYQLEQEVGRGTSGAVWSCRELSDALGQAPAPRRAVKIIQGSVGNEVENEVDIQRLAGGSRYMPRFYEASTAVVIGVSGGSRNRHTKGRLGEASNDGWDDVEQAAALRSKVFIIVMEFIEGICLGPVAQWCEGLPADIVRVVMHDVSIALSQLHRLGITHRDIKGDNILMSREGRAYLCDFGVSSRERDLQGFIGSPYFMAPEVAMATDTRVYNSSCDMWSLGITALQLWYGQTPAELATVQDRRGVLSDGASTEQERLGARIAALPSPDVRGALGSATIQRTIAQCLQRQPDQRCTAEDLLLDPYFQVSDRQRMEAAAQIQELLGASDSEDEEG